MRITHDIDPTPDVDFETLNQGQTVDVGLGTITSMDVSNLTGASGIGVWGAVIDPTVIPVELSVFGVE